jgi:hypothetical protein
MANRKNVWPSFQKFFSTLISPFMTSPVPQIPELFISPSAPTYGWYEVKSWARTMQSCNDAAQCFVERVVHCKCEDDKRHEFLRFEISSPTGSHTAIVFADRRVEVSQGIRQMATVLSPSPSPSASENLLATDVVWVATKGCPSETSLNNQFCSHLELRTLTFPHRTSRPSAQYLGALLQTTSVCEIYYDIYAHQCYWFAHTVFESLRTLHPSSLLSNGRDHKKSSQYRGSNIPKADSVDTVCSEFLNVWKKFLEREEEDRRMKQAEQELVSGCSIALTCTECAFVAAGEGSERESNGSRETGEEVGNSAAGVRG